MIEALRRIPLRRFADERGWFVEVNRAGWHEKPMRQTNVSFSRAGVIRGLHYHERGQDDLFVCLQGTARVVVLDLSSGETFTEDIGDENPVAIYVPGRCAHGFEALDRPSVLLPRDRGVRPGRPGRARGAVERPARRRPVEHEIADPVGTGPGRVLITGAGGQLGAALAEAFPDADALTRADWDVTRPRTDLVTQCYLVLHAAAWTDVDGAEADPEGAARVNVEGTRNVVALGAPVVYFSTDYVFDGSKAEPYVESDEPRPLSVYGRTKLEGEREVREGWIVRSSWLFGWTSKNFVRTMLELGSKQDEVAVVDDQRGSPTFVGHLAEATKAVLELPHGTYHVAAGGECTWAEFAEAIFEEAGLDCRVRRITTAELGRPAPRPANSVLRSETGRAGAPALARGPPRACLERLGLSS